MATGFHQTGNNIFWGGSKMGYWIVASQPTVGIPENTTKDDKTMKVLKKSICLGSTDILFEVPSPPRREFIAVVK